MRLPERRASRVTARAGLAIAGLAGLLATIIAAGGGFSLTLGGFVVRAHRPWVLIGVALVAAGVSIWRAGVAGVRAELDSAWDRRAVIAPWMAAAAATATLVVGLAWGTWAAGGSDSYGYVSQALLFTRGQLVGDEPLAREAPWPAPASTMSPLGYRPGVTSGTIVPTYPPGLPLVMAAAAKLGGVAAVFLVVPLAGMAAVWLTYLLGRWLFDETCGAVAAILLAASPVFLYQVVQPMSDVPVTAWWLAALVLAVRRRDALAGACAGAAVLTRPNLAPLALIPIVVVVLRERHHATPLLGVVRRLAIFGAPLAMGVAGLLWLNQQWYGHPIASGYGTVGTLFALSNIPVNLARYPRWLWDTQTPFVFLGLAAPLVAWLTVRRAGASRAASSERFPAIAPSMVAAGFALIVFASYLAYAPFEDWWYLRFLLPGLPLLLGASALVALVIVGSVPKAARAALVACGVAALAAYQVDTARAGHAFDLRDYESRYGDTGRFVERTLDPHAVLLAVQQSGSLRLYSGRETIRFDGIQPDWLDRALSYLIDAGYHPYFVLEAWEEHQFRTQFAGTSVYGRLDWPMAADIRSTTPVHIYDPADRQRYGANEPVATIVYRPNWSGGPSQIRTIHRSPQPPTATRAPNTPGP